MVRVLVVLVVVLAACAADQESISLKPVGATGLSSLEVTDGVSEELLVEDAESELCALAEALPPDDLCSLICDPDALRAAMLDAGAESGRCYLMLCALSEDVHAQVGVCLY